MPQFWVPVGRAVVAVFGPEEESLYSSVSSNVPVCVMRVKPVPTPALYVWQRSAAKMIPAPDVVNEPVLAVVAEEEVAEAAAPLS
jgi:hypothetical protein